MALVPGDGGDDDEYHDGDCGADEGLHPSVTAYWFVSHLPALALSPRYYRQLLPNCDADEL